MDAHANHATATPVGRGRQSRRPARRPRVFGETEVRPAPTHEQIAQRAFEFYLARGDGEGDALGDWLSAERELGTGPNTGVTVGDLSDPERYH